MSARDIRALKIVLFIVVTLATATGVGVAYDHYQQQSDQAAQHIENLP